MRIHGARVCIDTDATSYEMRMRGAYYGQILHRYIPPGIQSSPLRDRVHSVEHNSILDDLVDVRCRRDTLVQLRLRGSEVEVLRCCRAERIVVELQQRQTGDNDG